MYKPAHSYRNPTLRYRARRDLDRIYHANTLELQAQVTEVVRPANVDDEYDALRDQYRRG